MKRNPERRRGSRTVRGCSLALFLTLAAPLAGQITEADRFALFTGCAPVYPSLVLWIDEDWNLSGEFAEQAVESRLRDAGIYSDGSGAPSLSVRALRPVSVPMILVGVSFWKRVTDGHGHSETVVTWERGQAPLPPVGDAATALQLIAEHMDDFVSEYLRVNAEACNR